MWQKQSVHLVHVIMFVWLLIKTPDGPHRLWKPCHIWWSRPVVKIVIVKIVIVKIVIVIVKIVKILKMNLICIEVATGWSTDRDKLVGHRSLPNIFLFKPRVDIWRDQRSRKILEQLRKFFRKQHKLLYYFPPTDSSCSKHNWWIYTIVLLKCCAAFTQSV